MPALAEGEGCRWSCDNCVSGGCFRSEVKSHLRRYLQLPKQLLSIQFVLFPHPGELSFYPHHAVEEMRLRNLPQFIQLISGLVLCSTRRCFLTPADARLRTGVAGLGSRSEFACIFLELLNCSKHNTERGAWPVSSSQLGGPELVRTVVSAPPPPPGSRWRLVFAQSEA